MMDRRRTRHDAAVAERPLKHRAIAYAIMSVAFTLPTACSSACQVLQPPPPETTAVPSVTKEAASPPQQIVICLDRSTSYRFTAQAIQAISDMIPRLVRPGPGWTIHVRWIQQNSFLPEAQLATIAIPEIPPAPTEPPTPVPADNPFARRQKDLQNDQRKQAQADHYLAMIAYQEDLAKIRRQVQEQAERLKAQPWQPAQGSDIWGCLEKASTLMDSPGDRWLLIASDLEEYGAQQIAAPNLVGARVHVIFFQADQAARAVQMQAAWRQRLIEIGAVDVQFHDPVEGVGPVLQEIEGP